MKGSGFVEFTTRDPLDLADHAFDSAHTPMSYVPLRRRPVRARTAIGWFRDNAGILESANGDLQLLGRCPDEYVLIGVPKGDMSVNGHLPGPDQMVIAMPGAEIDAKLAAGARNFVLQLPAHGVLPAKDWHAIPGVSLLSAAQLRKQVEGHVRGYLRGEPPHDDVVEALEIALGEALSEPDKSDDPRGLRTRRYRLAREVRHFLDATLGETVSLDDVNAEFEVSRRSMFRSFTEFYGTTPMAYRRHKQLLLARRMLRDERRNVTDAALSAGFSHFGRFTQMYKAYFGELPRDTSSRA